MKILSFIRKTGRCGALFILLFSFSAHGQPDKARLRGLLEAGKFAELEAEMSGWQAKYREGAINDEEASKAFIALRTGNPDLRPAYDKWVAQYPKSYAAHLARGYYLSSMGFTARGSEYAADTPRARFDDMRTLFRDARADLEASLKLDPKPTLTFGTLISMARADRGFGDKDDYLRQATALDPKVYTARTAYLYALRPEWGGSLDEMQAFVAQSAGVLPPPQVEKLKGMLQDARSRAELEPARRLIRDKQYDQALRLIDAQVAKAPSADAFVQRGRAYARMNQHQKALADFDRALELDPHDNCCAHTNRAYSYMQTGAIGKALPDLVYAAEERDDHWAARQLAMMYGFGQYGMKRDGSAARRWCERAAKQGDPWSMYCMGGLYHAGMGVQRDLAMAAHWFERAAAGGVADAQADIAYMYWSAQGVSWNGLSALHWWMRAATQGNKRAQQKLLEVAVAPAVILVLLGVLGVIWHRRKAVR